jgi:hypothetical protein
VTERRVLSREDGMIHGAPLPPNHYRVSIDFLKDGYRDYNLPYEINGSRYLVDLIETPLKWPASLVQLNREVFNYLLN